MKKLICLITFLSTFSFAHASSAIVTNVNQAGTDVTLTLEQGEVFTERLIDGIKQSPNVEEVINDWVEPGTTFSGPGFTLILPGTLSSSRAVLLRLAVKMEDLKSISISGNFISVRSTGGGFKALHQALLTSKSPEVRTQANPGRILRSAGEVAVLEGEFFAHDTQVLNCIPAFRQADISLCSIEL